MAHQSGLVIQNAPLHLDIFMVSRSCHAHNLERIQFILGPPMVLEIHTHPKIQERGRVVLIRRSLFPKQAAVQYLDLVAKVDVDGLDGGVAASGVSKGDRLRARDRTYCSSAYSPSSRPIPDCLKPPNGTCA